MPQYTKQVDYALDLHSSGILGLNPSWFTSYLEVS